MNANITEIPFFRGDYVKIKASYAVKGTEQKIYTVEKINPKTITLKEVGGNGRVRASAYLLVKVEPGSEEAKAASAKEFATFSAAASIPMGAGVVVRAKSMINKSLGEHLYVVLRDKADTVSLARLGGDPSNRYFPTIPKTVLDVVEHGSF